MPVFARIRSVHIALLICLYFVLLAVSYARAMPHFEAADEAAHFLYAHNLLEDRELPRILPREAVAAQTAPVDQWAIESHQPPLYYAIGALLISPTTRTDINTYLRPNNVIFIRGITANNHNKWLHTPQNDSGDTSTAVWILRAYSIALGAGTLWFIYLAARQISKGPLVPLGAMLLVASIPTFVSISASINNDNGVTFMYSVGVYMCLRLWRLQQISTADLSVLSVVLSLIALTKLTGASLFGIVLLVLAVGVYRGYWSRMRGLQAAAVMLGTSAVIAGWWYLRNASLYGDPLALGATRSLWGREFEIATTSGDPLAELERIAQSFWMMFGHLHLPVYGPGWVYLYAAAITVLGVIGFAIYTARNSTLTMHQRDGVLLLGTICVVITAMLLVGTRSVDISYGRLLFPALVGFAPLMLIGWRRLLGPFALLLILPLAVITFITPQHTIARAYPVITPVTDAPVTINATVDETLTLLHYDLQTNPVTPGDDIRLDLSITGNHPANPLLAITVVDPLTAERLGNTEIYPGIAPTDTLEAGQAYQARVSVPVDEVGDDPLRPRQLRLRLDWLPPTASEPLPWVDGAGNRIEALFVDGPTLVDPRYAPSEPETPLLTTFTSQDDTITLNGFGLGDGVFSPGDVLPLDLFWAGGTALNDWTLTVQLLDSAGILVTQADGPLPGYPTSAWVPDAPFTSTHTLSIPADAATGEYQIVLGWYRQVGDDFPRMSIRGDADSNGLLVLTAVIQVE